VLQRLRRVISTLHFKEPPLNILLSYDNLKRSVLLIPPLSFDLQPKLCTKSCTSITKRLSPEALHALLRLSTLDIKIRSSRGSKTLEAIV
jgi:hypothetical protein